VIQFRKGKGRSILRVCLGVRSAPVGDRTIPKPADRGDEVIGIHGRLLAAVGDGLLNHLHRVFRQQLQDPHVRPRAGGEPLALFEVGPQRVEAGRQFPLGKHEGMIQGRRPATEDRQIMLGLHDPFVTGIAAGVTSNDRHPRDHLDPIHICFDRHRLEGPASRDAVVINVNYVSLSATIILTGLSLPQRPPIGGRILDL